MTKIQTLAIIGGGPAGITAAIYAKRANLQPVIFTDQIVCGKVAKTLLIENFPGFKSTTGPKLCQKLAEQVKYLNIQVVNQKVAKLTVNKQGVFVVQTFEKQYFFEKVIIASGTKEKKLPTEGVLRLEGKGVSYCSSCDGYFFKNQTIAVVGSGNSALEETKVLAQICKKIYLLAWKDKLEADSLLIEEVQKLTNVEIKYNSILSAARGKDKLEEILVTNTKNQDNAVIAVSGLFVYVGSLPNTDFVDSEWKILDSKGYVLVNSVFATKVKNLYAIGDVASSNIQQYTTAVGSATIAFKDLLTKGFLFNTNN